MLILPSAFSFVALRNLVVINVSLSTFQQHTQHLSAFPFYPSHDTKREGNSHPRHNLLPVLLPPAPTSVQRLEPPTRAETPLAAAFHATDGTEVVALPGCEVEEFFGDFGCDAVIACGSLGKRP